MVKHYAHVSSGSDTSLGYINQIHIRTGWFKVRRRLVGRWREDVGNKCKVRESDELGLLRANWFGSISMRVSS
jgi:hypothetical protein